MDILISTFKNILFAPSFVTIDIIRNTNRNLKIFFNRIDYVRFCKLAGSIVAYYSENGRIKVVLEE